MSDASAPDASELRPIPGLEGYSITRDGQIWSSRGKQLRRIKLGYRGGDGQYLSAGLRPERRAGPPKLCYVHRALLLAWVGPPPEGYVARHLNDDPADNRIENLAWGTPADNVADKIRNGKHLYGEAAPAAKLTASQVVEIRRLRKKGMRVNVLAEMFGVSKDNIYGIARGRIWKRLLHEAGYGLDRCHCPGCSATAPAKAGEGRP